MWATWLNSEVSDRWRYQTRPRWKISRLRYNTKCRFLHPQHLVRIKFGNLLYCLCQMLTLSALQDVCVPTAAFVRVWLLEGQKLVRILRGKHTTLRFYHFRRATTLFCCVLAEALTHGLLMCLSPHQKVKAEHWYRPVCAAACKRRRPGVMLGCCQNKINQNDLVYVVGNLYFILILKS